MWPNEPCSGKGWPGLVRSVSREHVVRVEVRWTSTGCSQAPERDSHDRSSIYGVVHPFEKRLFWGVRACG
eukprot:scaffold6561_cov114-Isochrysis_galbana.AAC.1